MLLGHIHWNRQRGYVGWTYGATIIMDSDLGVRDDHFELDNLSSSNIS